MRAAQLNLPVVRGEPLSEEWHLTDGDENPLDLTGYEFRAEYRDTREGTPAVPITVTVLDATTGRLRLFVPEVETSAFPIYNLRFRFQVKEPSATEFTSYVLGQLMPEPWPGEDV